MSTMNSMICTLTVGHAARGGEVSDQMSALAVMTG
jgi:hypothetical protein